MRARAVVLLTALIAVAGPAAAQELGVGAGAVFESYSLSDPDATGFESVTLVTLPFGAAFSPTRGLTVTVSGAYARGAMTLADGDELTVSGLTDTSLRASWALAGDAVTLSAAALLPTGKVEQTLDEARVAGAVAYDLLPFRISNWGSGGGADASVAAATTVGDGTTLGLRVGYRLMAEHEPFDPEAVGGDAFVYDPGDQIYARAALQTTVGAASRLSLSATWQTFGDDASEGTNLYRSGDRIQGMASLAFPTVVGGSGWIYGGVQHRTEGIFLEPQLGTDRPAQTLFFGGVGGRFIRGDIVALPAVDVRILRTEDGVGQGYTAGVGGSLEVPLGDGPKLVPTARARFGNLVVNDEVETGFTGFEVGVELRGVGR